jgi:hypothetical protein
MKANFSSCCVFSCFDANRGWGCLQLSPVPAIKLQKSVQIGNTPVCLRVQYEVPLDAIDEPLKPPARFFIRCASTPEPNHGVSIRHNIVLLCPCRVAPNPPGARVQILAVADHIGIASSSAPCSQFHALWLRTRLDNNVGSGLRLGTTGVEIDQRLIKLGPNTAVRFAGVAKFPRQLPVKEGEKLIDWQVDRLGLKTRW